jgi:hypothetical protein
MAEELGRTFARLGLIEGRRSRSAGQWVPMDANEVFCLMTENWSKAGLPLAAPNATKGVSRWTT